MPVEVKRSSDGVRMTFCICRADAGGAVPPRRHPVAGGRFHPADRSRRRSAATADRSSPMSAAIALDKGQAIRIRLNRPQLASLTADDPAGAGPDLVADARGYAADAVAAARRRAQHCRSRAGQCVGAAGPARAEASAGRSRCRRRLTVVTALPPSRGFIRRQDFVEFSLLETIHGVVVQAEFRRRGRRSRHRQGDAEPARRSDAVAGRCRAAARVFGGAPDLRCRPVAQGSGRPVQRAARRVDQRRLAGRGQHA